MNRVGIGDLAKTTDYSGLVTTENTLAKGANKAAEVNLTTYDSTNITKSNLKLLRDACNKLETLFSNNCCQANCCQTCQGNQTNQGNQTCQGTANQSNCSNQTNQSNQSCGCGCGM